MDRAGMEAAAKGLALSYLQEPVVMLRLAAVLAFALPVLLSAQSWCPPGTEWNWELFGFAYGGYVNERYTGDTLIGGRTAQRIHRTGFGVEYQTVNDTIPIDQEVYTSTIGADVYLWTNVDGVDAWDTLFRFQAVPGDRWQAPVVQNWYGCTVEVMDTATIHDHGIPLRQLIVGITDGIVPPSEWGTSRITERIGYEWGNWNTGYGCILDGQVDFLRCYADDMIAYTRPGLSGPCAIQLGWNERQANALRIAPNPGADGFRFMDRSGAGSVVLHDATGREVLRVPLSTNGTVDCSGLSDGSYTYRLLRTDGTCAATGRWVKAGGAVER